MSRFIRVALAGCMVLGLSLMFSTPAAQAKGGHSSPSHSHPSKNHMGYRGKQRDYKNRRYDWRYWYPRYYSYGVGCGCEVAEAPVATPDCGCMPTCGCGEPSGCYDGCGYDFYRKYRRDRNHDHDLHRGGHGRVVHSSGHGRK